MKLFEKVSGKDKEHDIKLFAISTCPWCKKVKSLLKSLDIEYEYVDIDELSGDKKKKAHEKIKEHNPQLNVPTLVIDGGDEVIVGYKKDKIQGVLKDE